MMIVKAVNDLTRKMLEGAFGLLRMGMGMSDMWQVLF
jgi:hypothetical protein